MNHRGRRVTVVGLGIEGTALVRHLAAEGAQVTVSDAKPAEALAANLARIADLPVRLSLGANRPEDCLEADVVFVSQGVPLDISALAQARQQGVPFSSVTRLFMERCPAPILGITGSAGKTTTTALAGAIFQAAGQPALVGGNIGVMLLDRLAELTPRHWAVLEISHTQLELTDRSPRVAVVTNISPSHADRYPSMEQYIALKERMFRFQGPEDWLALNWDDPVTRGMAARAPGKVTWFSLHKAPPGDGAFIREGTIHLRQAGGETAVLPAEEIRLMGEHNVANVLAACAATAAAGAAPEAMATAVRTFTGVEHRLEWVRQAVGADYYNDSIATTPERTVAGLRCFNRPVILLAGGREKHLPLESWVAEVTRRCAGIVFFGEAGPLLEQALAPRWDGRESLVRVPSLEEAVAAAARLARPADVVLLSPACTSFDQYPNFEARGRHFKELVEALPDDGQRSPTRERRA
ncbi:MAG: UDP-N-acetylmuramoyl-L-alanine--D-glutamate ligase [Chloroflexi bacterium]|nr:UDP-N-acetylmuramoyl-L-alanine--D-glutamate ligase [Chloroflexota bacterium]